MSSLSSTLLPYDCSSSLENAAFWALEVEARSSPNTKPTCTLVDVPASQTVRHKFLFFIDYSLRYSIIAPQNGLPNSHGVQLKITNHPAKAEEHLFALRIIQASKGPQSLKKEAEWAPITLPVCLSLLSSLHLSLVFSFQQRLGMGMSAHGCMQAREICMSCACTGACVCMCVYV